MLGREANKAPFIKGGGEQSEVRGFFIGLFLSFCHKDLA